MDKNNELEIRQKLNNDAFDKAQSQMYNLKQDIVRQKEEIRVGGDGTLPVELLKNILNLSDVFFIFFILSANFSCSIHVNINSS